MKTNSLILGAAALMLATSCSNDEVVKVAENSAAIGFSSFVNNSTRATDFTVDNLGNLQVWGLSWRTGEATVNPYAVFTGDLVTKGTSTTANTTWGYDNLRYWVVGNDYHFAAVAPANQPAVEVTPGTENAAIATIAYTNDGELDLLYAEQGVAASTDAAAYGVVGFDFYHMLSRVKFEFINEMNETFNIQVSDITVNDVATQGIVNKAAGDTQWESNGTATANFTFPMSGINGKNAEGNPEVKEYGPAEVSESNFTEHKYLIPFKGGSELAINFTISVQDKNTGVWIAANEAALKHSVVVPNIDFQAGYSYTLKTRVNGDNVDPEDQLLPIEFDVVKVENWKEDGAEFVTPTDPELVKP